MLLERSVQGELQRPSRAGLNSTPNISTPAVSLAKPIIGCSANTCARNMRSVLPTCSFVFYSGNFELVEALATDLFPNLPLVAVGTVGEEEVPRERLGANVTGVVARADLRGTMELIMKAQPETRRIVVIGGTSATDRIYVGRAEKAAQSLAGKVEFEFWTNQTMAELRQTVGSMPPRTAILMTTVFRDSAGEMFDSCTGRRADCDISQRSGL